MQNEQQTEFELVDSEQQNLEIIEETNIIPQAEWCFQFFDNEPVVFAYAKQDIDSPNLVFELRPTPEDTLVFQQNGMIFKIFPREMSEESKQLRDQQNANQNQEAAQ
jgi:hypothetical protein